MKSLFTSLPLMLAAGFALPLTAAPPKHVPAKPETIIEASAQTVILPAAADGILAVKACNTCPLQSYRATRATVYSLAGKPSSLNELRATIASNPRINIDITLSAKTREIELVDATPQGGNK
jgi:hypothetical protein